VCVAAAKHFLYLYLYLLPFLCLCLCLRVEGAEQQLAAFVAAASADACFAVWR
jgi:hypothetical protein